MITILVRLCTSIQVEVIFGFAVGAVGDDGLDFGECGTRLDAVSIWLSAIT
tara:strand:- start:1038 stop:1190 length:153 start_codon:yes stop_codon:yes gene_type:complete